MVGIWITTMYVICATPSIMGAAKIHSTFEVSPLAVFTTHGGRSAVGYAVLGAAVVGSVTTFAAFAATAMDACISLILSRHLEGIHSTLVWTGRS